MGKEPEMAADDMTFDADELAAKYEVERIKRMTEYLGESYFNYLAGLDDLVVLMDESHHYRADRGMTVINELDPILGLELTATPQTQSGTKYTKFKNVVYEYSLAQAIADGDRMQRQVAQVAALSDAELGVALKALQKVFCWFFGQGSLVLALFVGGFAFLSPPKLERN